MNPKPSCRIFEDIIDGIVRNRIRPFKKMFETETVIAIQPYVGAYPQKSPGVLEYYVYAIVREAVVYGQMAEFCTVQGRTEQQKQYGNKA